MATYSKTERVRKALALLAEARKDVEESGLAYLDSEDVQELGSLIEDMLGDLDGFINGGP